MTSRPSPTFLELTRRSVAPPKGNADNTTTASTIVENRPNNVPNAYQAAAQTNNTLPAQASVDPANGTGPPPNLLLNPNRPDVRPVGFQDPEALPNGNAIERQLPGLLVPEDLPGANADVLSLDQAVQLCIINDPILRAGLELISQSNADALTASLKPNPILFADIQLLPLTRPFTVTKQGGPPQQDVMLTQPIDWFVFGKRAAAMASADNGIRVSQADYEDLIRQRVTLAKIAYFDVAETENIVRIARQDVSNLSQFETNIKGAVEAGGRPFVEANRIRLALLASRRTLRDAESQGAMARARLNALVGGTLTKRSYVTKGAFDAALDLEIPDTGTAYEIALQNRPDLNSLRWRVNLARSNMLVEQRRAKPDLAFTLGYTRQYQLHSIGFPDADSWLSAVTMPLPIYNRNQGNRMRAQSIATQSQFVLEAGELALWSEIESVLAELAAAKNNANIVANEEMKLAEQVIQSIRLGYVEGGRTLLELLDAQRNYRETYRAFINTRANYWRARAKFQSAIAQGDVREPMP